MRSIRQRLHLESTWLFVSLKSPIELARYDCVRFGSKADISIADGTPDEPMSASSQELTFANERVRWGVTAVARRYGSATNRRFCT